MVQLELELIQFHMTQKPMWYKVSYYWERLRLLSVCVVFGLDTSVLWYVGIIFKSGMSSSQQDHFFIVEGKRCRGCG